LTIKTEKWSSDLEAKKYLVDGAIAFQLS